MESIKKRQQAGEIAKQMIALGKEVEEKGGWGEADQETHAKFDKMHEDQQKLIDEAEKLEITEKLEKAQTEKADDLDKAANKSKVLDLDPKERANKQERAFMKNIVLGENHLSEEERELLNPLRVGFDNLPAEARAMSVGTNTAGGFLVPEQFANRINEARLAFGGMRQVAQIIVTETGGDLPYPTANDGSGSVNPVKGAILSENTQVSEKDLKIGSVTLQDFTYSSKAVRVSWQLMLDAFNSGGFDLEDFIARKLGERIGRIENEHFTTGDGSSKPLGVVAAGIHPINGSNDDTITADDLLDLLHHVDPDYRVPGIASFMFNDTTLKVIKKLSVGTSDDRPLWLPGIDRGEPDTLYGFPYVINQDVADIAASAKPVLFGDFRNYVIRDVLGIQLVVLRERYADFHQIGFLAYSRTDGDYVGAGTRDIAVLRNIST